MKKLVSQIIKFSVVGGFTTVLDFCLLLLWVKYFEVDYKIANVVSFIISLIANYFLSRIFVFTMNRQKSEMKDFIMFCILSIIGLLLNEMILIIAIQRLGLELLIAKVFATVIVMVWNFVSKKVYYEVYQEKKMLE